jgi:hydrogenase expression/formation protein HypD
VPTAEGLRDPELAGRLAREIRRTCEAMGRPVRIMEVCGTHTVALRATGVRSLLPEGLRLLSGPGCPVCVTPAGYIDNALCLVEEHGARVATFGDLARVPGTDGRTLARHLASGRVRVVYSPSELRAVAAADPAPLVFLGVGFETTVPTVASAFLADDSPANLLLYPAFKRIVPALSALLADRGHGIDAFLLPGHVSTIIGERAYGLLEGVVPAVIAGFEPVDLLHAILLALRQVAAGEARVENAYPRAVKPDGNPKARAVIDRLLEPGDEPWRGFGVIPGGSLVLRPEHRRLDAGAVFDLPPVQDRDPPGCRCAEVLRGQAAPRDCGLFARACTPDHPVGPCMVSSEGACAAQLKYG